MTSNPWNLPPSNWKDSNSLGKSVHEFIMENPQWVLYLRRDETYRCPKHFVEAAEGAKVIDLSCSFCMGFGVKTTPQLVPGRSKWGTASGTAREATWREEPGYLGRFVTEFDFPRSVYPKEEDVVCICEWNKPAMQVGKKPLAKILRIDAIYVLKQINPYFEQEIGWYNCGSKSFDLVGLKLRDWLPFLSNVEILEPNWPQEKYW